MKNTGVRLVRFGLSLGLGLAIVALVLWAAVAAGSPVLAAAAPPAGRAYAPSATTVITHSGNITSNQTWPATATHVVSGIVTIKNNAVLTIEAGTLVKFTGVSSIALYRRLEVNVGTLVAVGTAAQPITFTSYAPVPVAGDWGYLWVDSGAATLSYVRISYGLSGVRISSGASQVSILSSTISHSSGDGVDAAIGSSTALVFSNTVLRQNGASGVKFTLSNPYSPTLMNNQYLSNTGAAILMNYSSSYGWPLVTGSLPLTQAFRGNALNLGIAVQGSWKLPGGVTDWTEDSHFERVVWDELVVDAGYTLRVSPGGVVKFRPAGKAGIYRGGRLIVNGVLDAVGTPTQPITFTSLEDNSAGKPVGSGDVQTKRWDHISIGGRAIMQHTVVRYGGGSVAQAIEVKSGGQLRLSDSQVHSSVAYGLQMAQGAQALFVTRTQVYSNTNGGVRLIGGASTMAYISASQVISNNNFGIQIVPNNAIFQPILYDVKLSYNTGPGLWVAYNTGWGQPFISGTTAITHNTAANDALALSGTLGPSGVHGTLQHDPDLDYVIWADFKVGAGFTLTLPPGLLIKAQKVFAVEGVLLADAAGSQPITMTSYHDNSVGRPLGSGSPARGDWPGIQVSLNGRAVLSNLSLRYATNGLIVDSSGDVSLGGSRLADNSSTGIKVVKGRLTMSDTQLANNTYQGLLVTGGQVSVEQSEVMTSGTGIQGSGASFILDVDSCTIRGNTGDGLYASLASGAAFTLSNNLAQQNGGAGLKLEPLCMGCMPVLSHNTYLSNTGPALLVSYPTQDNSGSDLPAITDLSASGNGLDRGVAVQGTLRNNAPISLQLDPAVGDIVVWDNLSADRNTTVTVQAGTVFKLKPNKSFSVKDNSMVIFSGTASQPITVTSIDDNSAGQPNGDGVVSQADQWGALDANGAGTRLVLRSTRVRYGARNAPGMVMAQGGGRVDIQSSQLSHGYQAGLHVVSSYNSASYSSAYLTDTQVFSNTSYSPFPSKGGIQVNNGTLELRGSVPVDFESPSSVYGSAQFGIYGWGVVTLTMDRTVVRNNGQHGVYVPASSGQLSIESSAILTNSGTGLYVRGIPTPTVHWTDFVGNAYGVNGDPATCVDALYNWWGDSLGPHDPLKSGCDTIRNYNLAGQWVNDYVSYRPWLTESVRVRGVSLSPNRQAVLVPGVASVLTHTLLNTGNAGDSFVLTYTASHAPGWVAGLGPALVTLQPGAQATVFVTLNVPAGVLSGTQNSVSITANSLWGGEKIADTVTDTLWAGPAPAASMTPTSALSDAGTPGQTMLYTFAITNQSNYTETYDPFGSTPHSWLISSTAGSAQIGIGQSAPITFGVRIPAGTPSGTLEVASLSVRSVPAGQVVAGAFATTTVLHQPGVDLYPDHNKVIRLGQTYTHVHHLVNAGNYTDSYTLTASSSLSATHWGFWPTSAVLAGGAQATVCLTMTMPSSAALDDIHMSVLTATSWVSPALQAVNTDQAKAGDYFSVTLSSAVAAAPPDEQYVFGLDLFNAGNDFDTFTITTDTPQWFVDYSPTSAGLGMELGTFVYVTMQVPFQAISDTHSTVVISATSAQSPTVYATATATLYAQRVVSFALDGGQAAFASPQTSVSFTHVLTSDSNYTDTFEVSGQSLYGWPVSGDSLTLGPYTSGAFTVTVSVPPDAISGTMDVVTFTASSQATPAVSHPVVDRVTATRLISLSLTPGGQYSVLPGDAFDILHSLANNGNYTEEFTLDVQEQSTGWIVDGPPSPLQLGPGQAGDVMFSIRPPLGSGGVTNTFTLTVTSQADPLVWAGAVDQVAAINYPGIEISLGESRQVRPGEFLTFTHMLTNTGSGADSFEIEVSSAGGWPVTFTPHSPIPIASGYTKTLLISVSVPMTAPAAYTETLTVKAASTTDPKVRDVDGDEMVVQFVAGLALAPGQARTVDLGGLLSYTHVLTNLGNGTDVFAVTAASSRGWLTPEMQSTAVTLTHGQTATLVVTLTAPTGSGGLVDTTVVTATSQADAATWASAVNTTTVTHDPDVMLSPGQAEAGLPGQTLSYVHAVTNTGNGPDSFAVVALSSHGWQVACAPAVSFTLGFEETSLVTVSVTLPAGSGGLVDTTVVTVSSQAGPTAWARAVNTTTVTHEPDVVLSPGQVAEVMVGQTFNYTHVVTNTGNGSDNFVLTAASSQFWLIDYTPPGPFALGAGGTAIVVITLTVPPGVGGLADTTTVTVTSQADSAVYAHVSDTTTVALEPGVALSPGQVREVDPGESVVYTHWVTNVGSGLDNFTITVSSSQGWLAPGTQDTSVALAANQAAAVLVTLTVPPGTGGLLDTTAVTVSSQADSATWASAVNTTSVVYT
ncbi:MAG: right-handed parallel beta-helix repeat-containing protein, partial [Thermoflexales bacterium]|nr:right-handed parallel beta-helix repeat-containing protein [Thermoflexales bacterium]